MITVSQLRAVVGLDDSELSSGLKRVQSNTDQAESTLKEFVNTVAAADASTQKAAASAKALASEADKLSIEERMLMASVKNAASEAEKLASAESNAAAATKELASATKAVIPAAKEASAATKDYVSQLREMAGFAQQLGIGLSIGITAPILAAGAAAVKTAVDFDSLNRGLMAITHDSVEAERQFRSFREVAKLPGLGLEEAEKGAINLQAAGFSAEEARKSLLAFGNALATVGKGKVELDHVNLALTQLANKTSGFGQDIRQLQEQLPQLRQALMRIYGTADTEAIGKMGQTGKQVAAALVEEFSKLPKVVGGAQNSFENFSDSMKIAGAEFGKSALVLIGPVLEAIGATAEHLAKVWTELPAPIQLSVALFVAAAAAAGPLLLIMGTLAATALSAVQAWKAYIEVKAGVAAAEVAATETTVANTVATEANTVAAVAATGGIGGWVRGILLSSVAVTGFSSALKLAVPLLGAFTTGYLIGTELYNIWNAQAEAGTRAAAAIEDETKAHEKSFPHLEEAIRLREHLNDIDRRAAAGQAPTGIQQSPFYLGLKKQADEEASLYEKAQEMMRKGFSKTEAEAATNFAEMRKALGKEVERMQDELNKLQAPDIMSRLKLDYPGLSSAELENARRIEESVQSEKELKKILEDQIQVLKQRADSIQRVKDEIEKARISLDALKNGSIVEKTRASLPLHTPDVLVRQLAAINQERETFEKARKAREDENRQVLDLTKKIAGLGLTTKTTSDSIVDFSRALGPSFWKKTAEAVVSAPVTAGTASGLIHPGQTGAGYGGRIVPILPSAGGLGAGMTDSSRGSGQAVAEYTRSLTAARPTIMQVVDAQKDLAEQSKIVREIMAGIGIEAAGKLITGLIDASREFAVLTAKTERQKIALRETGKTYEQLSAQARVLVDRQVELKQKTVAAEQLKKVADAWNDQRVALLKLYATTDSQRIALDLLKKSYESLTPLEKQRIDEMARSEAAQKRLTAAQEQVKATTEGTVNAFNESRQALLLATATTEKQRVELGLWSAYLKDVPGQITDAAGALEYLRGIQQSQAKGIDAAASAIVGFNAKAKMLEELRGLFSGDFFGFGKMLEDAKKATAEFDGDIAKRIEAAKIRIAGAKEADPAQAAWLKFLAGNNSLTQALTLNTEKAADAAKKFKEAWNLEEQAKSIEKERAAVADFEGDIGRRISAAQDRITSGGKSTAESAWLTFLNRNNELLKAFADGTANADAEFKQFKKAFDLERQADTTEKASEMLKNLNVQIREQSQGLEEGQKKVVDYNSVLMSLGLTSEEASGQLGTLVESIVEANKKLAQVAKYRKIFTDITNDMKQVFENAFGELFQHGFKGFFDSIISGFDQMLQKMAAQFLASQLTRLISNLFGSLLGGIGGGAGGGSFMQAGEGGLGGMAATGATASAGVPYLVGERGPEIFIPTNSGRVMPHGQGMGQVINYSPTYHITTPDANSFRRSEQQIAQDGRRQINRMAMRNGDRY